MLHYSRSKWAVRTSRILIGTLYGQATHPSATCGG